MFRVSKQKELNYPYIWRIKWGFEMLTDKRRICRSLSTLILYEGHMLTPRNLAENRASLYKLI